MVALDRSDHAYTEVLALGFAVLDVDSNAATVSDHKNVKKPPADQFIVNTSHGMTSITSSL